MAAVSIPSVLTVREVQEAHANAEATMRNRLAARKPKREHFVIQDDNRASWWIMQSLVWSKAFVPVLAILSALASSIRTIQTVAEQYAAAGTNIYIAYGAGLFFTMSVEGALFVMALAQAWQMEKWREEQRPRHVMSLRSVADGVHIRLGSRPALRHDEIAPKDNLSVIIWISFAFALTSNLYLGLKPTFDQVGHQSIQAFLSGLSSADAGLQLGFIVSVATAFFAPFMGLKAGHLTARFAVEVSQVTKAQGSLFETAVRGWNDAFTNPLATDEGEEVLTQYLEGKAQAKLQRQNGLREITSGSTSRKPSRKKNGRAPVNRNNNASADVRAYLISPGAGQDLLERFKAEEVSLTGLTNALKSAGIQTSLETARQVAYNLSGITSRKAVEDTAPVSPV